MIRAFFGSRVCCAIAKKKKKNSFTRTKSIYKGSLRTHRTITSAAFKEEEEEDDMSSQQQTAETTEEEHKVTPEFPKGEEYPSGRVEEEEAKTQSSFAAWEFAQGAFHGKKGFLVTSATPGSVSEIFLFCISWTRIYLLVHPLLVCRFLPSLTVSRSHKRRLSTRQKKLQKCSTTRTFRCRTMRTASKARGRLKRRYRCTSISAIRRYSSL